MPYFDPNISAVTDTYLKQILTLKLSNYDASISGNYCLTPGRGRKSLTYSSSTKEFAKYRPYATLGTGNNCFWKIIPHGNWLYSIVNRYNCPKDRNCGALLSFDDIGNGKARVTIDHEDPVLWEIVGTHQKRIRNKGRCPGSSYCNKELGMGYEVYTRWACPYCSPYRRNTLTGQLLSNYGYVWWLTKTPRG